MPRLTSRTFLILTVLNTAYTGKLVAELGTSTATPASAFGASTLLLVSVFSWASIYYERTVSRALSSKK